MFVRSVTVDKNVVSNPFRFLLPPLVPIKEKMKQIYYLFVIALLTSCTIEKETVMPYRNMGYSGERLFPLEKSESEFAFRAWINNGTSIDRVITVSFDSSFMNQAKLIEFGFLTKKGLFKSKSKSFYNEINLIPKSGFDGFFKMIDSLNLINYNSQETFNCVFDQPFSLYVIEIKKKNKYNQFQFSTYFPNKSTKVDDKFEAVQRLIFKEFKYDFYMKK